MWTTNELKKDILKLQALMMVLTERVEKLEEKKVEVEEVEG
mgnify:CR=1 FL=1